MSVPARPAVPEPSAPAASVGTPALMSPRTPPRTQERVIAAEPAVGPEVAVAAPDAPRIPECASSGPAAPDVVLRSVTPSPPVAEPPVAEPPVAERLPAAATPQGREPTREPRPTADPRPDRPHESVRQAPVHPPAPEPDRAEPAPDRLGEPSIAGTNAGPDHQPSNLDLASGVLVRRARRAPGGGWRRGVHRLTGGLLSPGLSASAAHHDELVARIRQPIGGDYRIAVLSLKGGVGKTTTTIGLGSTFASLRGDCVIAVDANPDFGTLAQRVRQQTDSTVRDLLRVADDIERYSDVRAHTSQAASRLEVLASERDPAVSEAFSEADYRDVVDILKVYYNIILTDCGTGIMHSAMRGVLDLADALVLVGSPAVDGARSAAATLDWLQHHGYGELVERTVVVISSPRPGATNVDMDALTGHFLSRCRALQVVPFDEHLAEGAEIDLDLLRPATRLAYTELAAMVADDFPALTGRHAAPL
ncbi:AAA family ATPase [Rhodococcus yananensis]|uniref:MinD/ParA family ATP-binding protein n=1 Tax=Rhodococcus yananensis TaxID=2879464 RepID=UPI003EBFB307